jgi:hypothetical protein
MFTIMRTIFLELKFFLSIAPVLAGGIIAPFAVTALKSYQFYRCLFARHKKPLYVYSIDLPFLSAG